MGHDAGQPKRSITVMLDADLVRRISGLTGSLSETVEGLLTSYVAAEEAKRADDKAEIAQWIAASNAMVAQFGAPGDDHSPF
jgi:predicted transcriptional regulator